MTMHGPRTGTSADLVRKGVVSTYVQSWVPSVPRVSEPQLSRKSDRELEGVVAVEGEESTRLVHGMIRLFTASTNEIV